MRDLIADTEIEILNPSTITIPKYQPKERFNADVNMLLRSDIVIVDARTKKGLGVGAEMVFARQAHIPILTWCPYGSPYRGWMTDEDIRKEWIHPFVSELSDEVFENIQDMADWIHKNIASVR